MVCSLLQGFWHLLNYIHSHANSELRQAMPGKQDNNPLCI
jgi:hypothetical protein